MGGAKKKSLSQIEKAQRLKEERERAARKKAKGQQPERRQLSGAFGMPNVREEELLREITKLRAVTPTALASQLGINVAAAKRFLEDLARRGTLTLVAGCSRLKIYKPPAAA